MLHYVLQLVFFQLIFLLAYELLLKKETFYNYNRAYLLLTPIIAVILPLLKLDFLAEAVPEQTRILLPEVLIGSASQNRISEGSALDPATTFSPNWYLITYAGGFFLSLILLIRKYNSLSHLYRFRKIAVEREFKIIEVPNSNIACTFFNTIFLGDKLSQAEKDHILSHELVHVKQRHSLDLVFFEALKIIFWFNPLIYIYQSRIAGLHEFIADEEVVKNTGKTNYYEQLLNTAFSTQNISFINQFFNHSLIKKRIIMLQKNQSSHISKFKFLLVIPLMLAMLTYVACSDVETEEEISSSLSQYDYSIQKGDDLDNDPEKKKIHEAYEEFLINNPNYVSWATIDYAADKVSYSVHRASEDVPESYNKMVVSKKDGSQYTMFMNLMSTGKDASGTPPPPPAPGSSEDVYNRKYNISTYNNATQVPFAVIDKVPAFPECDQLVDDARKNCTSNMISDFLNKNFDTSLGKKLGLKGINRVIVQFRIDETGHIQDIKSRAPHPRLEEEAKRVISELPVFIPGEQNGKPVSVMYSLPIAFQVQ